MYYARIRSISLNKSGVGHLAAGGKERLGGASTSGVQAAARSILHTDTSSDAMSLTLRDLSGCGGFF